MFIAWLKGLPPTYYCSKYNICSKVRLASDLITSMDQFLCFITFDIEGVLLEEGRALSFDEIFISKQNFGISTGSFLDSALLKNR